MKKSVTVRTFTQRGETRNVTLWLNPDGTVSLLGTLPHGTTIVIDQELVNDLQTLVNDQRETK